MTRALFLPIKAFLIGFAGFALGYFASVLAGAFLPANPDWREPIEGVPIYVETNGLHAGLVLPIEGGGNDWRDIIRPEHFAVPYADATHYRFGWGNKEFYRNVPTLSDATAPIVLRALFTPAPSAMHVDQSLPPIPSADVRRVMVTPAQYSLIVRLIRNKFAYNADGSLQPIPGNTPTESFYEAKGRYHMFETCNVWTNKLLKQAGIKTGQWTPFQGGVMRWRAQSAEVSPTPPHSPSLRSGS